MEYGCTIAVAAMPQEQPQAINLRDADRWHQTFNSGRESLAGVKVNHKSVVGYPAFWRGVNLLANGVSGLPIDVFERCEATSRAETHSAACVTDSARAAVSEDDAGPRPDIRERFRMDRASGADEHREARCNVGNGSAADAGEIY